MRPFIVLTLAAVFAAVAVGCGGNDEEVAPPDEPAVEEPAPDGEPLATFEVVMRSFELEPATLTIDEPGTYEFRAVNEGDHPHALAIQGPGAQATTDTVGPGETAEMTVALEAGDYELWCPVADHRELGMEGSVTVEGDGEAHGDEDAGADAEADPEPEPEEEADYAEAPGY